MNQNTNINSLRYRNKKILVDRAMGLYKPSTNTPETKEKWIRFLLEKNNIEEMLQLLKSDKELKPSNENIHGSNETHFSNGTLRLIDKDLDCYASGRRSFSIEITNNSPFIWETTNDQPLFIAYHWYTETGTTYEFDSKRTTLRKAIPPGESLCSEIQVIIPDTPGRYLLEPTLVLEGNFWLEEEKLSVKRVPITVEEYNGGGLTRHARNIYQALKITAIREES